MTGNPPEPWVLIGKVGKPIGLNGSVRVWPEGDIGEIFEKQVPLAFWVPPGPPGPTPALVEVRADSKGWVVKWRGFESRELSATLTDRRLVARREDLPAAAEGCAYWADLVGARVETRQGRELGILTDLLEAPGHTVIRVESPDRGEFLIPLTEEVDGEFEPSTGPDHPGRLLVNLPEGMEEATGTTGSGEPGKRRRKRRRGSN